MSIDQILPECTFLTSKLIKYVLVPMLPVRANWRHQWGYGCYTYIRIAPPHQNTWITTDLRDFTSRLGRCPRIINPINRIPGRSRPCWPIYKSPRVIFVQQPPKTQSDSFQKKICKFIFKTVCNEFLKIIIVNCKRFFTWRKLIFLITAPFFCWKQR